MNIGGVGSSTDCGGSRVTASQRLLNFTELPVDLIYNPERHAQNLQPSIRRERAAAGRYLQRRVDALRALKESTKLVEPFADISRFTLKRWPLEKMPHVLRKIIGNKPNIVCEKDEWRTAWNDSDFIAECLCWHNVYRFRHRVPPLVMSAQENQPTYGLKFSDNILLMLKKIQLCEKAQAWANHLAHTDSFFYRIDRDVGQNLFCRLTNALESDVTVCVWMDGDSQQYLYPAEESQQYLHGVTANLPLGQCRNGHFVRQELQVMLISGQEVSSYWYSAVRQYNFCKEPDILHANVNAGHFTQLVWASTRYLGVGRAQSRSGKILVVANYSPAGNINGQFKQNILPPVPDENDFNSLGGDSNHSKSSKSTD